MNDEITEVKLEMVSIPINSKAKKLETPWKCYISPYMLWYQFGELHIIDTRDSRSRRADILMGKLRKRYKWNIRLNVRGFFKKRHVKYCGSNISTVSWRSIKYLGRGIYRYYKRDLEYFWKTGKVYPRRWV